MAVVGVAGVLAAAAAAIVIAGSSGSPPTVKARAHALVCLRPLTLAASITTDGPATVAYAWASPTGQVLAEGQRRFGAAGSQELQLPVTTGRTGVFSLRLSAPGGQPRVLTFPVGC